MTISEARQHIMKSLTAVYDKEEASNIAELVIENVTSLARADCLLKKDEPLSSDQIDRISQYTDRLREYEPVQYVLKQAWFGGQKFIVDANVLIPRPETEELVEWIISDCRLRIADIENKSQIPNYKFLDIGTGSGCIAISLKLKLPAAEVWACDISDEALNIARINADSLHAAIDFVPVDFLDLQQQPQLPAVDIIVSNPPYVPLSERSTMRKNVSDHEPAKALFVADEDPLIFYKAIAEFGKKNLHENGNIYVEIHEDRGNETAAVFKQAGYSSVELKKDMQGKDRMIKAKR